MSYKINSLISSKNQVASYEKRLSICITSNGFSFSLCDADDSLLAIGDVECDLHAAMSDLIVAIRDVFAQAGIQPYGLHESLLVMPTRQFVWIPQHLYDSAKDREYIEALCKVEKGFGIYSYFSSAINAQIVFTADNNIVSAFKIAIPGLTVSCQHERMVNTTLLSYSDLKSVLLMNMRQGVTDFAVFCNKKLQISTSFDCANTDESLYHALNITKQFRLEDAKMICAVCGDVDRPKFAAIRRFFPDVVLYNGKQLSLTEPEMQHTPLYRFALTLS